MPTKQTHAWTVLLLGGHSGTGKTTVSRVLAQRFDTALSQVDDFRLVLQRVTSPEALPQLHSIPSWNAVAHLTPEQIYERLIAIAQTMSSALEIVIAHHIATNIPLTLEGDGITPALGTQQRFAGLNVSKEHVRAVFVVEPDEQQLLYIMRERVRGDFSDLPLAEQQRQVRVSWLYGQWLAREARLQGIPVISPQPWNTLPERIIASTG